MRLLSSCGKTCTSSMDAIVCNIPAIDHLRKLSETDDYTLAGLSAIDTGIIMDVDYVKEEDEDG